MYTYPRPEGTYAFSDIESIRACFTNIAHEIFTLTEDGYYEAIYGALDSQVAIELALNPEFKFDFKNVTTCRITLLDDGKMEVMALFIDFLSGSPVTNTYTITYKIVDGSEIDFYTSTFALA